MSLEVQEGESPNQFLREKQQEDLLRIRREHRNRQRDDQRSGLADLKEEFSVEVTEAEVLKLCNRIKRRKHADNRDLLRLSDGFLWSPANISVFLKIQGAVNVLVKELTGSDGERQLLAAETFCNLSLGDSGSCLKVAKLIASYLLTMIDSRNFEVAQTSLWILYNLTAESERALEVFVAGNVEKKLMDILEGNDEELKSDATKCLAVAVKGSPMDRRSKELEKILKTAISSFNGDSPWLIFEILRKMSFQVDDQELIHRLVILLLKELGNREPFFETSQTLFCIRILGNLSHQVFLSVKGNYRLFVDSVNRIAESDPEVVQELLWCLSNILKRAEESECLDEFLEECVSELRIRKTAAHEFSEYVKDNPLKMEY